MRLLLASAFLALLATAAPASAWLHHDDDCDGLAAFAGDPYAEDALRLAVADLDGDGRPDVACAFVWDSAADLGARAHEACHTVQQRLPAAPDSPAMQLGRACHGPGEVAATADAARKDASADCWNQARAAAGTPAFPAAARACVVVGDLDGDGALGLALAVCFGISEPGTQKACLEAAAGLKARHDVAMNAIRNMKG